jgi:hypothetical protein
VREQEALLEGGNTFGFESKSKYFLPRVLLVLI